MCNAASEGSFGSKTIAVFSPRFARCLSIQFFAIFTLASVNHLISASAILNSTTLSHCWYQVKFSSAILPQNFLGSRTDLL